MTDEMTVLGKRAVACKNWRWRPGMLTDEGRRVMHVWPDDLGIKWSHLLDDRVVRDADAIPDLSDPATLGCVLALVREAWEPYGTFVSTHRYDGGEWSIRTLPIPMFATEAEALVAALETAP